MNTQESKQEFDREYHSTKLQSNLEVWSIKQSTPNEDSKRHLQAILYFASVIGDFNDNPNPMILGMLWDARGKYFASLESTWDTGNRIMDRILEDRKGHYCHALGVSSVYELESIVESIIQEFGDDYTDLEYIQFFESMSIYALDDSREDEIFNFSFSDFIKDTV
ncbi:hypothetical protein HN682_03570 [Candidatus Peregrinibacteria bacterium]|nr:hypothetical protein [Candidatus Peregrinibacteria bacterium]